MIKPIIKKITRQSTKIANDISLRLGGVNSSFTFSSNKRVPSKFHMFKNWSPEYTMEKILIGIKNEMI